MNEPLRHLRPGDTVAVIAPSGPASAESQAALPALFDRLDLRVRWYASCRQRGPHAHLAGPDALRAGEINDALADPGIAAIVALRGGYGAMRLLPMIDTLRVAASRKPLVGYSDVTALHALWAHEGRLSVHAPMPASDWSRGEAGEADADRLLQALRRPLQAGHVWLPALEPMRERVHRPGVAHARLVGGNLSLIAALQGTPFAPPLAGHILFLEDTSEDPYRVDRLLTQLLLAGALARVAGVLLGRFGDADVDGTAGVLAERLGPLGVPILAGWPSGHGQPNHWLPLGAPVKLDATQGQLTLAADAWV